MDREESVRRANALVAKWKTTRDLKPLVDRLNGASIVDAVSGAIALGQTGDPQAASPLRSILGMGKKLMERLADDPTEKAISEAFINLGTDRTQGTIMHFMRAQERADVLCKEVTQALSKLETGPSRSATGTNPHHSAGHRDVVSQGNIRCPHCQKELLFSPANAGKVASCPSCRRPFTYPQHVDLAMSSPAEVTPPPALYGPDGKAIATRAASPSTPRQQVTSSSPRCKKCGIEIPHDLVQQNVDSCRACFAEKLRPVKPAGKGCAGMVLLLAGLPLVVVIVLRLIT